MSSHSRGMVTACCLISLFQDGLGKETYLRMAEERWTTGWVTVPLALLFLFIAFYTGRAERKLKELPVGKCAYCGEAE